MKSLSSPAQQAAIKACAGSGILLGALVMLGWHTGFERLVQVHPSFVPMQYNTALCFVLSGVGVLCLRAARRLGAFLGLGVSAVALVTLSQYVTGLDLGIDELLIEAYIIVETSNPGRMAPNTALAFVLAGAALATLGLARPVPQRTLAAELLACLVGALGLAAAFGYLTGVEAAYGWAEWTRMAAHTAVGFCLLGIAVFQVAWRIDIADDARGSRLMAFPAGIGALVVVFSLWQALSAWQVEQINALTGRYLGQFVTDVEDKLVRQERGFGALVERWGHVGIGPGPVWEGDVARFLRDNEIFQAISWADSSGRLAWIFPGEPFADYVGLDYSAEERRRAALTAARERRGMARTPTLELRSAVTGYLIFMPLVDLDGVENGIVAASVRLDRLFSSKLGTLNYSFGVYEDTRRIFAADVGGQSAGPEWTQTAELKPENAVWRLELAPTAGRVASMRSRLPLFVLVSGLIAAGLLALSVHLAQVSLRRTSELEAANSALFDAKKRLEHLALYDDLTGLGNRNLFMKQLEHSVAVARRKYEPLALLLLDLNRFKEVNDTLGHEAGDEVLREFAARLAKTIREADQGFRLGGDEFAVLVQLGTPVDGAMTVARKIESITKAPMRIRGQRCVVGASIGIAVYPDNGQEPERLMRSADAAMYQAKRDSGSICVASNEQSPTTVLEKLNVKR